jgi:ABC-type sugar transport system permease subunit
LLPQLLLYTVFTLIPIVATVALALTNWSQAGRPSFIGLLNFRLILTDHLFRNAVQHSLYYAAAGGGLLFVPALVIAWCFTQPVRAKSFFRFLILAPVVLSISVAGLMWKWIYNPTMGLFNPALKAVGLGWLALPWLGEPATALTAIIVANLWHGIGIWVLLLLAGLDRLPPEVADAARVDGANERQVFFLITLPLLWELVRILIVLWVMDALQAFAFVFVMTAAESGVGGPMGSTDVMATYVYTVTFRGFNWAYGMALATAMMLLIFVVSMFTNRALLRETVEF